MHALSCPKGGLPSIRYNEIQDLTAPLMIEIFNDVRIEGLDLQPLTGEHFDKATAVTQNGARVDISAYSFWRGIIKRPL